MPQLPSKNIKTPLTKKRTDTLFINHSKKTTLEYITCKKYDVDEINFYKEIENKEKDKL